MGGLEPVPLVMDQKKGGGGGVTQKRSNIQHQTTQKQTKQIVMIIEALSTVTTIPYHPLLTSLQWLSGATHPSLSPSLPPW